MPEQRPADTELEEPKHIRDDSGQRSDGRPTGQPDDSGLAAGREHHEVPTEAPEEHGETPSTEHAPGESL